MSRREDLRNPAIAAAIDDAVARGDRRLFDLLCRHSGLPGPRPNTALGWAVAGRVASLGARADALVADLCSFDIRRAPPGTAMEYLPITAALSLGARYIHGVDRTRSLAWLRGLAEDPRRRVRDGVVVALWEMARARGDAVVSDLAAWMDGYLPAAVTIDALTSRQALDRFERAGDLLGMLDRTFSLIEGAARSDRRSQGYRTLLETLLEACLRMLRRFTSPTLLWLESRASTGVPDLRRVIAKLLERAASAGRKAGRFEPLAEQLDRAASPRRDPRTYVGPTRQRGSKRRRKRPT